MTADAMLAVIRERHKHVRVYAWTTRWAVYSSYLNEIELGTGETRWQAIFAAYRAVRASQGKAVIEA